MRIIINLNKKIKVVPILFFIASCISFVLILFHVQSLAFAESEQLFKEDINVSNYTAQLNNEQTNCHVVLSGFSGIYDYIQFAVGSEATKQGDLIGYNATQVDNDYVYDIVIENFRQSGLYFVDAYGVKEGYVLEFLDRATFNVSPPTAKDVIIYDVDYDLLTFNVKSSGINSASGVHNIAVAVWTENGGQDDIKGYDMNTTRQYDGAYTSTCKINISNHNYESGLYNAHVYINTNNKINTCIATCSKELSFHIGKFNVSLNEDVTIANILLDNISLPQECNVKFAVGSDMGGQDDLFGYDAARNNYTYFYNVFISNHKTLGTYIVDAYYFIANNCFFIDRTTFIIEAPRANVSFYDIDTTHGQFKVKASNINPLSSIEAIEFACWPEDLGVQSVIGSNPSVEKSDVYVEKYNVGDFDFAFNDYYADVYVTTKSGIKCCIGRVIKNIQPNNYVGVKYIGNGIYKCCTAGLTETGTIRIGFPTGSEFGGQDDLKGYFTSDFDGTKGIGTYSAKLHGPAGLFYTDFYAIDSYDRVALINRASYNVPEEAVSQEFHPLHNQYTGIDVSEHQQYIDGKTVADSCQVGYAMVRAGYGINGVDKYFEQNYTNARANGVPVGIYGYSYAENEEEARQEAYKCLEVLKGRSVELPVAFDLEQFPEIDPGVNTAMINAFCSIIASAGYVPMVYASEYWYNNKFLPDSLLNSISFGVAKGSSIQPSIPKQTFMRIWQTSDSGNIPGINGYVDIDWLYY